jgi:MFS family permease
MFVHLTFYFLILAYYIISSFWYIVVFKALNTATWQNAVWWGLGTSIILSVLLFIASKWQKWKDEQEKTQQMMTNFMGYVVGFVLFPNFLTYIIYYFFASWHHAPFAECVLRVFSLSNFTLFLFLYCLVLWIKSKEGKTE